MSRPIGCNQGDPNAFTTYTGGVMQMTLADGVTATSPNVVLTQMNQVQFCGNLTLPASLEYPAVVATVPESCRPDEDQWLSAPCAYTLGDSTKAMGCELCSIDTNGQITVSMNSAIGINVPVFWCEPQDDGTVGVTYSATPHVLYLDSVSYDLASIHYGGYNPS